jgi:hypothetical protein
VGQSAEQERRTFEGDLGERLQADAPACHTEAVPRPLVRGREGQLEGWMTGDEAAEFLPRVPARS